jgi:hypothetical protein
MEDADLARRVVRPGGWKRFTSTRVLRPASGAKPGGWHAISTRSVTWPRSASSSTATSPTTTSSPTARRPGATGVIDFAGAHAERPPADIGYGLWRSGRPRQEADHLDPARIARFLRGYATVVPVSADEARAIPVYIRGRGLQMIAKRVQAGRAEAGMMAQVRWLGANTAAVGEVLAAAVG